MSRLARKIRAGMRIARERGLVELAKVVLKKIDNRTGLVSLLYSI